MANASQRVLFKLPGHTLRRIPAKNRSEFLREAVEEKLQRQENPIWTPKTATGRKLLLLRKKYIAAGGELPGKPLFRVSGIKVITLHAAAAK